MDAGKPVSVVETPDFLAAARKLLSEGEKSGVSTIWRSIRKRAI